jgi:hypothetical protein
MSVVPAVHVSDSKSQYPQVRHGALLGLAAILPARAAGRTPASLGATLETQKQRQLGGLVAVVERARLLRGRGGELMRAALCRCSTTLWCLHMLAAPVSGARKCIRIPICV